MSAAENLYGDAEKMIRRGFRALEVVPVHAAGYDPKVDGGRPGSGVGKIDEGAWIESMLKRLPEEERDAIRAYYQGRGVLESMRRKNARWRQVHGVWEQRIEAESKFDERILRDLGRWEMDQLNERRNACHRLAPRLKSGMPNSAVIHLCLEWANLYDQYATEAIIDIMPCHPSTVTRARKSVYKQIDQLRNSGIWGIVQHMG